LVGWLDWTGLDWKEENVAFDVSRGRFCLDVFFFLCAQGEQLLGRKYQAVYLGLGSFANRRLSLVGACLPFLASVCPATTAACVIFGMGVHDDLMAALLSLSW
jgi:hypothetical protein